MTDEYQIDNVTWAEKDSNGNIVVDPDVVNTDGVTIGARDTARDDSDFDDALNSASNGHHIRLGKSEFGDSRTITKKLTLEGIFSDFDGTYITGDWSLNGTETMLSNVRVENATLTLDSNLTTINNSNLLNATISINGDDCAVTSCFGGTITFNSGTDGGIVDSGRSNTVTDNGSNTIGDIA